MAELEPGAKVAKDLGIYLGQIYGYVKRGLVTNHKEGGYPEGKGLIVDPDEVRAAWSGKHKGPRKAKITDKAVRNADTGEMVKPSKRSLKTGTIVSYETGRDGRRMEAGRPHYNVATVLGSTGRLTYLDDGGHRRHYSGTQIDNLVFGTDRLSLMLAKGVARIENPQAVLGMVILAFIMDDKVKLASSLEVWMEKNGLEVHIPEVMDLDDDLVEDEPEPEALAAVVGGDDD